VEGKEMSELAACLDLVGAGIEGDLHPFEHPHHELILLLLGLDYFWGLLHPNVAVGVTYLHKSIVLEGPGQAIVPIDARKLQPDARATPLFQQEKQVWHHPVNKVLFILGDSVGYSSACGITHPGIQGLKDGITLEFFRPAFLGKSHTHQDISKAQGAIAVWDIKVLNTMKGARVGVFLERLVDLPKGSFDGLVSRFRQLGVEFRGKKEALLLVGISKGPFGVIHHL